MNPPSVLPSAQNWDSHRFRKQDVLSLLEDMGLYFFFWLPKTQGMRALFKQAKVRTSNDIFEKEESMKNCRKTSNIVNQDRNIFFFQVPYLVLLSLRVTIVLEAMVLRACQPYNPSTQGVPLPMLVVEGTLQSTI